jgi:hypothetical protein
MNETVAQRDSRIDLMREAKARIEAVNPRAVE